VVTPISHPLDARAILYVLNQHQVSYVIVGGYGAVLHGSPMATRDLNITPSRLVENLQRLAAALTELGARIRIDDDTDGVESTFSAASIGDQFPQMANLRTPFGDLDLTFAPAGPAGTPFTYERLAERAVTVAIPEPVPVAALDDIIASKEAANRPKDRLTLGLLYELRDEVARRAGGTV